jgi:putative Mg2+ transporter-C (MgtC) family protein
MALIALGSCAFTLIGYAFASTTGDSGRVAAQIVTGIGFLGGGVLLRDRVNVQGMTTAATIWVVAAIGMTVGAGYAVGGIGLAIIARGVLTLMLIWESSSIGGAYAETVTILFDPDHGKSAIKIGRILDSVGLTLARVVQTAEVSGKTKWVVSYQLPARHKHEFLGALAEMPEIYGIETEEKAAEDASLPERDL